MYTLVQHGKIQIYQKCEIFLRIHWVFFFHKNNLEFIYVSQNKPVNNGVGYNIVTHVFSVLFYIVAV